MLLIALPCRVVFCLKEQIGTALDSSLTTYLFFEIFSTVDVLLIPKKLWHRKCYVQMCYDTCCRIYALFGFRKQKLSADCTITYTNKNLHQNIKCLSTKFKKNRFTNKIYSKYILFTTIRFCQIGHLQVNQTRRAMWVWCKAEARSCKQCCWVLYNPSVCVCL